MPLINAIRISDNCLLYDRTRDFDISNIGKYKKGFKDGLESLLQSDIIRYGTQATSLCNH